MVRVETGARLHLGFQNLSLAHERLYGGVGLALADPTIVLEVERAQRVQCDDPAVQSAVTEAVSVLDVPGAEVTVAERFGRHVGLGSGTQLALGCLAGIARAYDREVDPRSLAPDLGRGGRSGVGVATFERGGFVVDAGHPTERFTSAPPAPGAWTVPPPIVARPLPADWRFVLVVPDTDPGPSGPPEDERMRAVVERADPGIADTIATLVTRELLPAVAEGEYAAFGAGASQLGRLNGAWYADEQGGVYRPPAGEVVEVLDDLPGVAGAGQSSWGPTVYGVTRAADDGGGESGDEETIVEDLGTIEDALADRGIEATVSVTRPRNRGVRIDS